ncbi:MAG: esterase [Roseburia sp.]|nr:esterase [Roseburia sp.]
MRKKKRVVSGLCVLGMLVSLTGCGENNNTAALEEQKEAGTEKQTDIVEIAGMEEVTGTEVSSVLADYVQEDEKLTFDSGAWNYDEEHDVYYQIGVGYCSNPETVEYETMGIYVPGMYLVGEENGDGTYTCTLNSSGTVKGYTAATAPIVFPVNTAGYSAQEAPVSYQYESISEYLEAGFVYVYAGMRGRSNGYDENGELSYSGGAPWGVTDLKAAVRYYRYNSAWLPGNTDSIFTFGHSGGGAQSAVMGASGDSEMYYPYLTSIGAAMYDGDGKLISDAICGAMCWCPITSLDYADAAYEWNMGQYADTGTRSENTYTSALSKDLAEAYASYINELGLQDGDGNVLTLTSSEDGIYAAGSYYDYMVSVVEQSLNNFLSDTEFPYTAGNSREMADGGFGGGGKPDGERPDGIPSGEKTDGEKLGGKPNGENPETGAANTAENESGEDGTYETPQEYIDSLNAETVWVNYDEDTNTATITSLRDFATYCKTASKDVGAFDDLNLGQAENMLFGNDESDTSHFDTVLTRLLAENQTEYAAYTDWNPSVLAAYQSDMENLDKLGNTLTYRQNMYNPMYYISSYYEGSGTSTPASYWRIRSGIEQGDTALTVETNLALALEACDDVTSVDFETVWEQGHTTAERTGDSTANFIAWVQECAAP